MIDEDDSGDDDDGEKKRERMPRARRIKFSTPFKHHFRPDDLIALLLQFDRRAHYYYKESFLFPRSSSFFFSSLRLSRVTLIINVFFAMRTILSK